MSYTYSTFEQFSIIRLVPLHPFGNMDLSFTNSALFMLIAALIIISLHSIQGKLIPSRWQSVLEILYEAISNVVKENIGTEGSKYFPFVLTIFLLIATMNIVGIVPYTFTPTAHIIVALGMSVSIWIGCTILGLIIHRSDFFAMFMPAGTPIAMAPLIVPIELISYCTKAITLGVRLAANITAGHLLFAILAGFTWKMLISFSYLSLLSAIPFLIVVAITILEMAVALIQAYVFSLLLSIYINDTLHLH
jgi:ATP synthase subunit 6